MANEQPKSSEARDIGAVTADMTKSQANAVEKTSSKNSVPSAISNIQPPTFGGQPRGFVNPKVKK